MLSERFSSCWRARARSGSFSRERRNLRLQSRDFEPLVAGTPIFLDVDGTSVAARLRRPDCVGGDSLCPSLEGRRLFFFFAPDFSRERLCEALPSVRTSREALGSLRARAGRRRGRPVLHQRQLARESSRITVSVRSPLPLRRKNPRSTVRTPDLRASEAPLATPGASFDRARASFSFAGGRILREGHRLRARETRDADLRCLVKARSDTRTIPRRDLQPRPGGEGTVLRPTRRTFYTYTCTGRRRWSAE